MVDDDSDDCLLVETAPEELGFPGKCRFVKSGDELLDHLHQSKNGGSPRVLRPDLILRALHLPKKCFLPTSQLHNFMAAGFESLWRMIIVYAHFWRRSFLLKGNADG